MIEKEQAEQIRKQLLQHIESSMSGDDKEVAKKHIESLDSIGIEEFLKRNDLNIKPQGNEKCVFCSIIFKDIPSSKIDEDSDSIAVLEINPISKGHVIIIPKNHTEKIPELTYIFGEKISGIIKEKLLPKDVISFESSLFNHKIINLIPVYKNETKNSERYPASEKELEDMQKLLSVEEIKMSSDSKKQKKSETFRKPRKKRITKKEKMWLPKRIP
ncbi:HIT domain-containing protein [Candidatus Pacearchaeota archaeon]|nr:HIT domain-containing protein [Candidatus Pacearchaeota archaeon]